MEKIVCECGHENPYGTILCESCGKPLEAKTREILTYRYEGSARRSQTYHRTPIDKIWNFFSSVKVGVTLIVLVFIASGIGTIFPQEMNANIPLGMDAAEFYQQRYGVLGKLYYILGFNDLYGSWWFMVLIALLGLSIIIASIDRGIPLHRALKNQSVTRHDIFIKRQRLYSSTAVDKLDDTMARAKHLLKAKHYKIREENGNVYAEKGRFSRWGAYVNHTGLIIIMIGAMLRFVPGMYIDDNFWVSEGQTAKVPGTHGEYYVKNHKFIMETYSKKDKRYAEAIQKQGKLPKNFQTNVSLYHRVGKDVLGAKPELKKEKNYKIRVNHPLKFAGFSVYQVDYQLNALSKMSFTLSKKSGGKSLGKFTVDLFNPKSTYRLGNGYKAKLMGYFPDFYFNDKDEPATKSRLPNNPAFIFKMISPDKPKGEISFIGIRKNIDIKGNNKYKLNFAGLKTRNLSALNAHKDNTIWVIIIGAIIFMIGVVQGLYWQYRRIWLKRKDHEIWLAGSTNKNWFGLKKDIERLTDETGLSEPVDRLEKDKKKGKEEDRNEDGSNKQ